MALKRRGKNPSSWEGGSLRSIKIEAYAKTRSGQLTEKGELDPPAGGGLIEKAHLKYFGSM